MRASCASPLTTSLHSRATTATACSAASATSASTPRWLLFIDFDSPRRLRVNGAASLHFDDPLREAFTGAQLVVRVRARRIFPNCPRYIHRMQLVEPSPYVPRAGTEPPVPKWKQFDAFRDVLPRGDAQPPPKG